MSDASPLLKKNPSRTLLKKRVKSLTMEGARKIMMPEKLKIDKETFEQKLEAEGIEFDFKPKIMIINDRENMPLEEYFACTTIKESSLQD